MASFFNNLSIAKKLYAAFGAVLAIFIVVLAVTLSLNGKANTAHDKADEATAATEGAALQIRGIQTQMTAQAAYAATADRKYKDEFEKGVALGEKGSKIVEEHGDTTVAKVSASAKASAEEHDRNVTEKLFPAVAAGNREVTLAALATVDRLVRVGYDAALKIQDHNATLESKYKAEAKAASAAARKVAIIAALLALALGIGVAYVI